MEMSLRILFAIVHREGMHVRIEYLVWLASEAGQRQGRGQPFLRPVLFLPMPFLPTLPISVGLFEGRYSGTKDVIPEGGHGAINHLQIQGLQLPLFVCPHRFPRVE